MLLLVSPDFLDSDYCYDKEMSRALERHAAGACIVIPVILRPCDWHDAPFGKLMAAPTDGKPITQWPNIDEAFLNVTKATKAALAKRNPSRLGHPSATSSSGSANTAGRAEVRSSNLRVAKRFNDRDKDHFLQEAFEYVAKCFENSLTELAHRNPGIEGKFRRIDANRFTAVAYRDGQAVARCSIRLGDRSSFAAGITFSHNDSAADGSFNESLSVENDDQTLYLKPLGMSTMGRGSRTGEKLSPEGGAEFYWGLFIEPLQRR